MPFFANAHACSKVLSSWLFIVFCFLTIASVSAFDTWSAAANSEILTVEKNPICTMLLELDPDGRRYFVLAKSLGAIGTLAVLGLLLKTGYRHAKFVTGCVATFQFGLMIYLCFADSRFYGLPNFFLYSDSPESIFIVS
jgi:hypothetical protein